MPILTLSPSGASIVLALWLAAACGSAHAAEPAPDDLPRLQAEWQLPNPYRGNAAVLASGGAAYSQHCAKCHGENAVRTTAEGPDLRRLNSFCNRLSNPALKAHCLKDVDSYYLQSVREGKLRAGSMHMPAWQSTLPQETIWAIRSFTETRPLSPPRTLPDLPPGGAKVTQ